MTNLFKEPSGSENEKQKLPYSIKTFKSLSMYEKPNLSSK